MMGLVSDCNGIGIEEDNGESVHSLLTNGKNNDVTLDSTQIYKQL